MIGLKSHRGCAAEDNTVPSAVWSRTETGVQLKRGNTIATLYYINNPESPQVITAQIVQQVSTHWKDVKAVNSPNGSDGAPGGYVMLGGINPKGEPSFAVIAA